MQKLLLASQENTSSKVIETAAKNAQLQSEKDKLQATLNSLVQKIVPDGHNTSIDRVSEALLLRIDELEKRESRIQ